MWRSGPILRLWNASPVTRCCSPPSSPPPPTLSTSPAFLSLPRPPSSNHARQKCGALRAVFFFVFGGGQRRGGAAGQAGGALDAGPVWTCSVQFPEGLTAACPRHAKGIVWPLLVVASYVAGRDALWEACRPRSSADESLPTAAISLSCFHSFPTFLRTKELQISSPAHHFGELQGCRWVRNFARH